jgi:hypothetical protein
LTAPLLIFDDRRESIGCGRSPESAPVGSAATPSVNLLKS